MPLPTIDAATNFTPFAFLIIIFLFVFVSELMCAQMGFGSLYGIIFPEGGIKVIG